MGVDVSAGFDVVSVSVTSLFIGSEFDSESTGVVTGVSADYSIDFGGISTGSAGAYSSGLSSVGLVSIVDATSSLGVSVSVF